MKLQGDINKIVENDTEHYSADLKENFENYKMSIKMMEEDKIPYAFQKKFFESVGYAKSLNNEDTMIHSINNIIKRIGCMYDDKGNNKEIDSLKKELHCLINKYKEDKMTELGVYYIESCLKNAKRYLDDFSMEQKDEFISNMERYAYINETKSPNYAIKINSYGEIEYIKSKYSHLFYILIYSKDLPSFEERVKKFQNEIGGLIQNFDECKKELEKELENISI